MFVALLGSWGPRILAACKVLSRGVMISSALVPVFVSEAPFEYRLSLGSFTFSFLVFQCIYWRVVAQYLVLSLAAVVLPLATLYPFPGISLSFVVLRIPLLLALLSVIAVEIGHFLRIHNQEAALTQPMRRSIPSWLSECNLVWEHMGGPDAPGPYRGRSTDISLSSESLSSLPHEWDSQTRRCFTQNIVGADHGLLPLEEKQIGYNLPTENN